MSEGAYVKMHDKISTLHPSFVGLDSLTSNLSPSCTLLWDIQVEEGVGIHFQQAQPSVK